jgi:anti-sigma factor RsiW
MNCERLNALLEDYVDGVLAEPEEAELERHVGSCSACRSTVERAVRLQRATRALPRGIAPERDLLPGIRARVGKAGMQRGERSSWMRWAGLAASLVVLTGAVWFGLRALDTDRATGPATAKGSAGPALLAADVNLAEFEAAESEYEEAAAHLLEIVESRREELSPETLAVIEENLRIIDEAIDEVREALKEQPGDTRNGHMLNALYRQKVEFLWMVSRLSS